MKTLFIAIIMVLFFAIPASSTILFYEDFEDALDFIADPDRDWVEEDEGSGGSQGLTTEQVRAGSSAYKCSCLGAAENRIREQLTLRNPFNNGSFHFTYGDEFWIAFSVLIADGFYTPTESGTWGPLIQEYHGHPDACDNGTRNPILSFRPKDGDWTGWDQWTSLACTPEGKVGIESTYYNYGSFSTGQWYDFVINTKWSYESDGFIKVWLNGVLETDRDGPNAFNDVIGPYFMIGIYGWLDDDQTVTFYFDEVRIGDNNSSYSEVMPGEPPPIFPDGWGRICDLVIQANKIDANQSNFPVLLTEDTLPLEMFDADGSCPALNGGGDIRFSSDSAGNTRLSCEIVTFITDNNPANGVAEIWTKVPSISSSSDVTIYVWYDMSGESQPAVDAAYGSESVWDSNFKLVQHMNEDPSGGAPQMIDSTSSDGDGTSNGTMTSEDLVIAQIEKGLAFDGSNDYVDTGSVAGFGTNADKTISVWVNLSVATNTWDRVIIKNKQNDDLGFMIVYVYTTDKMDVAFNDGTEMDKGFGSIAIDTWYHLAAIYDESAGTVTCYKDGVAQSDVGDGGGWNFDSNDNFNIGARAGANAFFNGIIDEIHISTSIRTLSWIKAEYNNQNDPSTFVIEGTPWSIIIVDHFMIMGM